MRARRVKVQRTDIIQSMIHPNGSLHELTNRDPRNQHVVYARLPTLDAPRCRCYRAPFCPGPYCSPVDTTKGETNQEEEVLKRIAVPLVALWTVCCSVVWQIAAASDVSISPPYGPLRLVNQQPLQLLFLQAFPEEVHVTPRGHLGVHLNTALTNTLVRQDSNFTANLDLEMVRTVFDVRYGVRPDFEIGLELPLLYTYGGILDDFILDFERFFLGRHARDLRRH